MMRFDALKSEDDVCLLVEKIGFLPFFSCEIPGFSVQELTPGEYWFVDGVKGPWEWKEILCSRKECAYGKFFHGRAGYISKKLLPHFINLRRDGYDFDAGFDDGLYSYKDKEIMDAVQDGGAILSNQLKEKCGYGKGTKKGFETVITRLQMQTYLIPVDFEYKKDKSGKPYGWGIAKYDKPEALFGYDYCRSEYSTPPEKSLAYLTEVLQSVLNGVPKQDIISFITGKL